jgi:iron complex outermembrane recepter protein
LLLTTSRIYETGVKHLLWDGRAEWTLSLYDIERKNVYSTRGGHLTNIAGLVHSEGVELAGAVRPTREAKLWANVAYVNAKYSNFTDVDTGESFDGNTPPNVPHIVANAGVSYTFATRWPLELGASVRYVGSRFLTDNNAVTMLGYTLADAYAFVDLDKTALPIAGADRTRVAFRVRNLFDKRYAAWSDPGYPDQVLLGAPRSYEVSASFRF